MFNNRSEQEARNEILEMVKEYCDKFHNVKKEFEEGDRISYASRVYDHNEMVNLVDSALEFWLTSGRYTDDFERKLWCNREKLTLFGKRSAAADPASDH